MRRRAVAHDLGDRALNRVIVSRKGLDSSFGTTPSPIFPDGTMTSIPIPDLRSPVRYSDIAGWGGRDLGGILADLTGRHGYSRARAHLDPDLDEAARPRDTGWQPAFGQQGGHETHLSSNGVGEGDLFLFFGWFRRTEESRGVLRFVRGAPHLHVVFGWLRVDRVLRDVAEVPPWLASHPHAAWGRPNNAIYIGQGGVFRDFADSLVLTAPGSANRSLWRLPAGFPAQSLTFHEKAAAWDVGGDYTTLQSVGRGQDFVADTRAHPFVADWAEGIVSGHASRPAAESLARRYDGENQGHHGGAAIDMGTHDKPTVRTEHDA